MADSVQPWNGQQILAQNAQYSQAEAQAKLSTQEIQDQSRMEQQLKQLPHDLAAMQQLEAIQTAALRNGRLDAAEKAAGMIGQLSARTEATVLKTEQAAKVREQTQKAEKDDILDLMSSSTDQHSWDMNRMLVLSSHPEAAKGMFELLSQPFNADNVKTLAQGRMTPQQRAKASQEAALAEEQAARTALIKTQIKEIDFMAPLKAAREAAGTAKDYAAISLDQARTEREKTLTAKEQRNGGKDVAKLTIPTTSEVKIAKFQLEGLQLGLSSSDSNKAAADIAAHAKNLVVEQKMTWEDAMRQSLGEFKGTFATEKNRFSKDTTKYVPRPKEIPSNFQVSADKPSKEEIAAGVPAGAHIWVDPTTGKRKWSDE